MQNDEIKYINMIMKEIIQSIDDFPKRRFNTDKQKIVMVSTILTETNLFLALLGITIGNENLIMEVTEILSFNLSRLMELAGYTEQELTDSIQKLT